MGGISRTQWGGCQVAWMCRLLQLAIASCSPASPATKRPPNKSPAAILGGGCPYLKASGWGHCYFTVVAVTKQLVVGTHAHQSRRGPAGNGRHGIPRRPAAGLDALSGEVWCSPDQNIKNIYKSKPNLDISYLRCSQKLTLLCHRTLPPSWPRV